MFFSWSSQLSNLVHGVKLFKNISLSVYMKYFPILHKPVARAK